MILLQSSPDVTKGSVGDFGYSLGYFIGDNIIEIFFGGILIIAFAVFLTSRMRKKRQQQDF